MICVGNGSQVIVLIYSNIFQSVASFSPSPGTIRPGHLTTYRSAASVYITIRNGTGCGVVFPQFYIQYTCTPIYTAVFHPDILARASKVEFWDVRGRGESAAIYFFESQGMPLRSPRGGVNAPSHNPPK